MRLHLSAYAALTMLLAPTAAPAAPAASAASGAPGAAATRNFTVTGFDRIRVDGPYRVKLTTNMAPFARAEGSAAALDSLSLEVEGRTLIIRRKTSVLSNNMVPSGPVEISAGTHELTAAWLNGSGGLAITGVKGQAFQLSVSGSGAVDVGKIGVDRLRVSVSGSASVAMGGATEAATFSVRGASAIDATALTAKAVNVAANGSAMLRLTATDTAKVNAGGLATVELAGRPSCTIRPTSSGEVSGCR